MPGSGSEKDEEQLLSRLRRNESLAQQAVFDLYVCRLLALVRTRLSPKFARRVDPEDVVQSAYRSFFLGAQADEFVLGNSGDLWRLLAAITIRKMHRQIDKQQAAKRDVNRENSMNLQLGGSLVDLPPEGVAATPTPDEAAALDELVSQLMATFDERQRKMFELRLAGYTVGEIAEQIPCAERTVRRFLDNKVKPQLNDLLNS